MSPGHADGKAPSAVCEHHPQPVVVVISCQLVLAAALPRTRRTDSPALTVTDGGGFPLVAEHRTATRCPVQNALRMATTAATTVTDTIPGGLTIWHMRAVRRPLDG